MPVQLEFRQVTLPSGSQGLILAGKFFKSLDIVEETKYRGEELHALTDRENNLSVHMRCGGTLLRPDTGVALASTHSGL